MPYADDELERLLAHGHLSGRAYDEIEARVLHSVLQRPRKSGLFWALAAALPAVTVLGGVALYLGQSPEPRSDGGGFTAKGAASSPAGTSLAGAVQLRCATDRGCRSGDTLHFLVNTDVTHGYLNASAQRITPPSPERIRLFPTEGGESPHLAALGGTVVVDRGVRLGGSLGPGVYRVDVWWTDSAPSADPSAGRRASIELKIDE